MTLTFLYSEGMAPEILSRNVTAAHVMVSPSIAGLVLEHGHVNPSVPFAFPRVL